MKRTLTLLLATALASPALAQHAGHTPPPATQTQEEDDATDALQEEDSAPAPATSGTAPAGGSRRTAPPTDPHAGHVMPAQAPAPVAPMLAPPTAADPHAGHVMPSQLAPAAGPAVTPTVSDPHAGHVMPAQPAPAASRAATPTVADPHAGHVMPAQPTPVTNPAATPTSADPHAGHNMQMPMPMGPAPASAPQSADPHAGHVMPAQPSAPAVLADPHAGHNMAPAQSTPAVADPHAGHDMGASATAASAPPATAPPAAAFTGPENAADLFYAPTDMAGARTDLIREHGGLTAYRFLLDQLEARARDGRDGYAWDAEAWYGGDINKLWVTTEGEGTFGEAVESAEVQALWSRAIDPWFDLQLGARQDFRSGPDRTYLVAGVQGLAPYWFEVEAMAFVSNKGEVSARFEAEYDLRLTQELILQPLVEFDLALQNSPEIRVGSGLSTAEIGARLRYEFRPRSGPAVIAPYVGVHYERAFGNTARYYRASGEEAGGFSFLVGVRTWF